ncbi:MAG: ferrochelatase [Pirellulales bacterium]|nr:ferrochelatase [Pirellulales bacterium]
MSEKYDAILILSFGGPEGPDDVLPFLENVLRGKRVPRERMLEVAEHYHHFGGRSPINEQNRTLIASLERELATHGPRLPIYWGNRNWHPLLTDTLAQMQRDGVQRALALVTSSFSSYSGCRQYLEDIERARTEVGPGAPRVDKIRAFFNHPLFIGAMTDHVRAALERLPAERCPATMLLFTAHSIPTSMAATCDYVAQLNEASRLVAETVDCSPYRLVYQSRSGPPTQPWLEPDVIDALDELHAAGRQDVVIVPIGFLSDHMEVLYDLDTAAAAHCEKLGLNMVRATTAGSHPKFATLVRELVEERVLGKEPRVVGNLPARPPVCPADCCASVSAARPATETR